MVSSTIILILLYLSPVYRTYYKATIKLSTTVECCYYKALHTRISDNCITFAMSHSVDWTTFNSNGLPTADGSVSRQNVGTVFYKNIAKDILNMGKH